MNKSNYIDKDIKDFETMRTYLSLCDHESELRTEQRPTPTLNF